MKILKRSKEEKQKILKKFEEYLNGLKDDDKISFEYNSTSDIKPKIIITSDAYIKIKTLVSKCTGEVGWNGTVERDGNTFKITDILVYPQTVTGATVTCDEIETGTWLMKHPTEVFNKIRFQAHSHVNMATSPSSVDRTMYTSYSATIKDDDFYIFMIFNKKDEYYIELIDKKTNAVYYKNDVEVCIGENIDEWYAEVSKNIKTHTPYITPITSSNNKQTTENKEEFDNCKNDCSACTKFEECMEYYMDKFGD